MNESVVETTIKYLKDALPQGETKNPYAYSISVRLDVVLAAIDYMTSTRRVADAARSVSKQAEAQRATSRVAIGHLQAVLNQSRTHHDQQAADTLARDWLISIGSEPS